MAFLTGFNVTLDQAKLLGEASLAAFASKPIPAGYTVLKPSDLGLAGQYQDGNYFKNGTTGASAIVLKKGNDIIVSFRGTDSSLDVAQYMGLYSGTYINHFKPLLDALKVSPLAAGANFSFTGASLGGGATNLMAKIAATQYGGFYKNATFVAFASPIITNANGILNFGVENDPVYKSVPANIFAPAYQDHASSMDNLVFATNEYLAGNYDGRRPYSMDAHSAKSAFDVFDRLKASAFYNDMNPDSAVVIGDSNGIITDMNPGRSSTGAFYLGRSTDDQMQGRAGNDSMEGFGGDDIIDGGAGNDRIEGGTGNDTLKGGLGDDTLNGGAGSDTLDGGIGTDTAGFGGAISNYSFALNGSNVVVTDTSAGSPNGSDTLIAIETLQLGTQSLTLRIGTNVAQTLNGAGGSDLLLGFDGADTLNGSGGNDVLDGGAAADRLNGGDGADRLIGGAGNDIMNGNSGNDTFVFAAGFGSDTINGFDANAAGGQDLLDISAYGFTAANFAAHVTIVDLGSNTRVTIDGDTIAQTILLVGINGDGANAITQADFLLV